jgi:hypothetical protein
MNGIAATPRKTKIFSDMAFLSATGHAQASSN